MTISGTEDLTGLVKWTRNDNVARRADVDDFDDNIQRFNFVIADSLMNT